MSRHLKIVHECDVCGLKFSSKGEHYKKVHPEKFGKSSRLTKCKTCSEEFKNVIRLKRHLKAVHQKYLYRCTDCNLNMDSIGLYRAHNVLLHPVKKGPGPPQPKMTFDCSICSEELRGLLSLKRHMKTVHQKRLYRCKDCNLNMDSFRLYRAHNVLLHPEKKGPGLPQPKMTFDCSICAEELRGFISLRRHMKTVHQKRLYKCKDCNLTMINIAVITAHDSEFHPERPARERKQREAKIPTQSCEICAEKFRTVTELGRHLNVVHRNKFYRCEDCDLTLASWHLFNAHNKKVHPENTSSERSGSGQTLLVRSH